MTRKRKCNSESNSFVAAAEQVCLQPVLEHRQRRGRRNVTGQAIPHLCSSGQLQKSTNRLSPGNNRAVSETSRYPTQTPRAAGVACLPAWHAAASSNRNRLPDVCLSCAIFHRPAPQRRPIECRDWRRHA